VDGDLSSAQDFVEGVQRLGSWEGEGAPPQSLPMVGARSLTRMLLSLPTVIDGPRGDSYLDVFSRDSDRDPGFRALQHEALGLMVTGALALGFTDHPIERYAEGLIFAATDIDPEIVALRGNLFRTRPFGPPIPVLPEWTVPFRELADRSCFVGVLEALREVGRIGAAHSTSDATGVTGVSPRNVCPGTVLQILGSGFGQQQPAGTAVYLPTQYRGCREVAVDAWTDTAITVTAPQTIGFGCLGFVRGGSSLASGSELSGALTQCFGAFGQIWGAPFEKLHGPSFHAHPAFPAAKTE
jgi:hypothetical protein